MAVLTVAIVLFATGHLELRWNPAGSVARDDHDHAGEDGHEDAESRVSGDEAILDAETIKASGITTASVERRSMAETLQVTGEVELPDARLAHVTPRLAGVVREVTRARGDMVAAGAPLAVLESTDLGDARAAFLAALSDARVADVNGEAWRRHREGGSRSDGGAAGWVELDQALADQASADAERDVAERNLARLRELQERGLRSRTELLAGEADMNRARVRGEAAARRLTVLGTVAETERIRARQRVEAARAKLRALGVEAGDIARLEAGDDDAVTSRSIVRSPIAGVVADRQVTVGQAVEPTAKIFTIADLSEVWVAGALRDRDVAAVRPGMSAVVTVPGAPNGTFRGRVAQIGTQVDEKTRTLPVRVAVQNPKLAANGQGYALRPGMFATVDLEVSRRSNALVVPTAAVQTLGGQPVVFVETPLTDGAAFQRRAVVLGARDGDVVEVTQGLEPGERIVLANGYLIKSEFERSKISHGHAH
jgi:cobalt-zinc-cadmium efflux system membrane fusion protein